MPQLQLPFFPHGATEVSATLAFSREGERIAYFHGSLPVFAHALDDVASFRMITSQFCVNGHVKQAEIARAFGVPLVTVKRSVKRYREQGPRGFYAERKRRGAAVLTPAVRERAQHLLDDGLEVTALARHLGIKSNTLVKAVRDGRLHVARNRASGVLASSKSARSTHDAAAPMGVAAHNVPARLAASLGALGGVAPCFEAALDVPAGGVLCALPALLAMGLLEGVERHFDLSPGYYALDSLMLLLAFMALARLPSIESLRHEAPGEWGRLLGLDRAPEVRTLRRKVRELSHTGAPEQWSAALCQRWMAETPQDAGVLYVDGHVRVYHGDQTRLPKHYVARERLCLRASVDYWVNAMDGQPFMVVNQVVDAGLIHVIEQEILARLEPLLPQPAVTGVAPTPAAEAFAAPHRFVLVFDREGYSPDFFRRLRERGIACLTYHKFPREDWRAEEFQDMDAVLVSGQTVAMPLAERGTRLSNGLWVREVRKLSVRDHQTAIISTDYVTPAATLAPRMFARWSQENFFRYMRQHYGLDRLADYQTAEITDPILVVNPAYRALDSQVRSANGKLNRLLAHFGSLTIEQPIETESMESFVACKAALHEQVETLQADVAQLKAARKEVPRHIRVQDLPEEDRFRKLSTLSKHFLDTIKMVAYRAESAMATIVRETMRKPDEARTLLQALYSTEADLLPDEQNKTLTVRLHHSARAHTDNVIRKLCDELNATQTLFPRTDLRLIYELGSSQNH
jgi:transposase-like protein